jgi:hypothetical protein
VKLPPEFENRPAGSGRRPFLEVIAGKLPLGQPANFASVG